MTLELTVISIILATILGLILGVLGVMPGKLGPAISSTIIYIFRGMPLMVLAFFIYIGFPDLIGHGFKIPAFVAGMITLMLNEGAYTGAFVKGALPRSTMVKWRRPVHSGCHTGRPCARLLCPKEFES